MIRSLFRFIFSTLRLFVRTLDFVVRGLFYAALIFGIGMVVAFFFRPEPDIPADSALLLRPSGSLVEQAVFDQPLDLLAAGGTPAGQNALADLLEAIRLAKDDARINALVIETDQLLAGGFSKLGELRAAILDFKASGKPVLARGERFTQGQYYLATAADEVHLSPDGFVLLHGLSRYGTYFKDALDSLGVKVHVFRVGEYKSFSEPFTRNDMSEEDRASSRDLLDGLWSLLRDDVAAARKLAPEAVDAHVNNYRDALAAAGGDAALAARNAGLVDRFSTRDEWRARLIERVGANPAGTDARMVDAGHYLAVARGGRPRHDAQVAVLVAQGAIVDGREPAGVVGGDTFAELIRAAREDEQIKALVLRIDSPGGSAWASEVIRRELELTRKAGKPVIASMSSVAASGGYWIAAGADEIWAAPATLTGSIGIFAMFPEFSEPLRRLGIGIDGVATAPLAGALDPRRPLSPAAADAMQLGIEHGYRRFLDVVGKARDMRAAEVDAVARGRVWTGAAAHELGLVDQLGGLEAAIAAAATRAGVGEGYDVVWPEASQSLQERLLRKLTGFAGGFGVELPQPASPSPLSRLLAELQAPAAALLQWNDPKHLYMHCLCEAP
ncbi:signal peptide peptidase SppA [Thauera linaloolentis]|uniref:Signal peptide peptidase SppA, 67K type n=1 Tax=Thauera linaloolentis (strain DSM 12138 / JCM 21573 / CCUG 41526 / CIP 105981 / IAM 15112 / NBRC 102519 / 47Lol) TaxID=1123367 RepID=N6YVT9_THAL4|nr:signal peptide peptidase SppA [Thauera linaloolentis]ENO86527.1 signal peptide peptidase SppA, 67K type [Thauera linaloolentis 47Lol = DSM 12138]MCM8566486.1 signal peptide peptidase SppA [Thauera linaloolentis]